LKRAADLGVAESQFCVGLMYNGGVGTDFDEEIGFRYLKLAADQGLVKAQFEVGEMYAEGQGVDCDLEEALKYLKLADQGYTKAFYQIGQLFVRDAESEEEYFGNENTAEIYQRAFEYFQKGADLGNVDCQIVVAKMFKKGKGVEQCLIRACQYYELASKTNDEAMEKFLALKTTIHQTFTTKSAKK